MRKIVFAVGFVAVILITGCKAVYPADRLYAAQQLLPDNIVRDNSAVSGKDLSALRPVGGDGAVAEAVRPSVRRGKAVR